MSMEKKALALLSGGLDSTLAVKMLLDQGIEMTALNFVSPFCNCSPKKAGCQHQASRVAEEFGIPICVLPKGMDYMRIVENPPHGYGRGMNPCVDCRIYMLKKAKEMMQTVGASFVVTGEVLGQRPMSQRRSQIELIERESGLHGLILRPLSAGHFPPSLPEREGIVAREKLLAFSGRSRKAQIELARALEVTDYPCPAGGCMLTDPAMALRLKDLFANNPGYTLNDLQLLKVGRHFRIHGRLKVIVGRNQEENEKIAFFASSGYILFQPENFRGPSALVREGDDAADETVGGIIARYSQDKRGDYLIRKQLPGGETSFFFGGGEFPVEELALLRLG